MHQGKANIYKSPRSFGDVQTVLLSTVRGHKPFPLRFGAGNKEGVN